MPRTKTILTADRAGELAEAFIADKRTECRCGRLESVHHVRADMFRQVGLVARSGHYSVTFEYAGPPTPPVFQAFSPTYDHPTVVWVGDRTGKCRLMPWL